VNHIPAELKNKEEEEEEEDKGPQLSLDLETSKEPIVQTMAHESPSQPAPPVHHPEHDRTSNLELEIKLLRKEVASLNEEMISQLQRAKDAEKSKMSLNVDVCIGNMDL